MKTIEERFWSKVKKTKTCWNWIAGIYSYGYGKFSIKYRTISAHRMSWELTNGPILKGLFVLHKCDNPLCVNPKHLFLGTNQDNMTDRNTKNRQAKSEKHGRSKLTKKEVLKIRYLYSSKNTSCRKLAKQFNVGSTQINRIINKKLWRYI